MDANLTHPEFHRNKSRAFKNKVTNFLLRLQSTLQLSHEEMRDLLRMTHSQWDRTITGQRDIELLRLCDLADKFGLSLDAILEERIDYDVLRQHYLLGNTNFIHERYIQGAFSKKRLIHTILSYAEHSYGWMSKENILNFFQMNKSIFTNPDDPINVYLFEDVLAYCKKLGFTNQDIHSIGLFSLLTTQDTPLAHRLGECSTPRELYETYFADAIHFIEKNNRYHIKQITDSHCVVESREIEDNLDIFKTNHIGGPLRCIYRKGALEAATHYIKLPFATVTEVRCCHRGEGTCTFHIEYGHLKRQEGQLKSQTAGGVWN